MIKIIEYRQEYRNAVIDFWVKICVEEFGFKEWENDIRNMDNDTYKSKGGNFWIAIDNNAIVGTISLKNLGNDEAILKSMYVQKEYRNKKIASNLMYVLLEFARKHKYKKIISETYSKMNVAIKLYEKIGFKKEEQIGEKCIYAKELKSKVGILTFQDAQNYGAVLQAYALKEYISKLGYEVKIINYHHKTIPDGFPRENNEKRYDKFIGFIKELIDYEEKIYISEEELEKIDIDFWICGSDQIWNTDITRGFNKGFFLDFKTNGKKISYAASMGIPKLPKEYEEQFKRALEQMDTISVREETLQNYAKKFVDKPIEKTLDPTLLLEESDYTSMLLENKCGEYILIYELGPDNRLEQIANKLSKERNIKIIELNEKHKEKCEYEQISDASPKEFLTLIKNAKVVITNSFHGTIFSIIFKKEFYTITRLNRNSRMENILEIIQMEDRLIDQIKDINKVKKQNYENAYLKLNKEREKSKEFLKKALK